MKTKVFLKTGIILLFVMGFCIIASADDGGYIITPHAGEYPEGAIVDDSGADANITFWDLPLWIQLSVITSILFSFLAAFKFLPLLLGKISVKKKNTKQKDICSYIVNNPGCCESEMSKNLNIKRGTLRYHLDRLESENMIFTIKKGKIKGFFHIDHSGCYQQNMLHLRLKNDTAKMVLDVIITEPGVTGQELSSKLGLDKSTIHWHVNKLREDNIVHIKKHGKYNKHYLVNDLKMISENKSLVFAE